MSTATPPSASLKSKLAGIAGSSTPRFKLTVDEAIEFATAAASFCSLRTDHPDHLLFALTYDCRRRWTDRLEAYP